MQNDRKFWPFKIAKGPTGRPEYVWKLDAEKEDSEERRLKPEEISTEVLKKLKEAIQDKFDDNTEVIKCIVTIPAHFNQERKEATLKAIRDAGLHCVDLLEEPVAAALE